MPDAPRLRELTLVMPCLNEALSASWLHSGEASAALALCRYRGEIPIAGGGATDGSQVLATGVLARRPGRGKRLWQRSPWRGRRRGSLYRHGRCRITAMIFLPAPLPGKIARRLRPRDGQPFFSAGSSLARCREELPYRQPGPVLRRAPLFSQLSCVISTWFSAAFLPTPTAG